MKDVDFKYMTEALAVDLAEMVSSEFNLTVAESLDVLYNSETYAKLMDSDSGLYFQSPGYVYSFLKNELATGKIA